MQTMDSRGAPLVAVTGLGLVSALGLSVAEALRNALSGKSGIRRYEPSWAEGARVGGIIEGFDAARFVDADFARRYEPAVNFALGAAEEALSDARLESGAQAQDRFGCVIGAGIPGAEIWHRTLHLAFAERAPSKVASTAAIAITGNAATGIVALKHKLRGPSFGVANACASGATALSLAADQIRLERADVMLAGGTESSTRSLMAYASFAAAGGMNTTQNPDRALTPFARNRRGFVLGEGAALVVLERLDRALARGATVYGVLAGEASSNDAHHIVSPDASGAPWARTIALALRAARVEPDAIDVVSAHAAGTMAGDLAETRALKSVFGAHAAHIRVSATKAMHGHAFGATGAIETVLGLAAMRSGYVLPTLHLDEPDVECDLDYVAHRPRQQRTRYLLKNSFGANGAATCLIIRNFA